MINLTYVALSRGPQLQRALLHLLIDGPGARDTGALLAGRWARAMHLRVRGSPIIARAQIRQIPRLSDDDLREAGFTDERVARSVIAEIGSNSFLLPKVRKIGDVIDRSSVRETLAALGPRWVEDLPWEAVSWLRTGTPSADALASSTAWEAVQPLLASRDTAGFALLAGLQHEEFQSTLLAKSPTWPKGVGDSRARFAELLAGVREAIWVDRYLLAHPPELLAFVRDVTKTTGTRLRLLFSSTLTSEEIRRHSAAVRTLAALPRVELRSMTRRYYVLLHDRQIAYCGDREDGVIVPTTAVILGKVPPGTAVAVQVPVLERRLIEEAWNDSLELRRFLV